LQEQRSGRRIEPMGVVDHEDQHAAPHTMREARASAPENVEQIPGRARYRSEQPGERAERHRRGCLGCEHELNGGPARAKPTGERPGGVALPDPCIPDDHTTPAAPDRLLQTHKRVPPAERPR
jgi:hypothetical protein